MAKMVSRKRLNVTIHVRCLCCYFLTCTSRLNQMHRLFSVKWGHKLAAHLGVLLGIAVDKEEWSHGRIQRPSEPWLTDVRINTKTSNCDLIRNLIFLRLKFLRIIHKIQHLPAENKRQVFWMKASRCAWKSICITQTYVSTIYLF